MSQTRSKQSKPAFTCSSCGHTSDLRQLSCSICSTWGCTRCIDTEHVPGGTINTCPQCRADRPPMPGPPGSFRCAICLYDDCSEDRCSRISRVHVDMDPVPDLRRTQKIPKRSYTIDELLSDD